MDADGVLGIDLGELHVALFEFLYYVLIRNAQSMNPWIEIV